ATPCSSPPPPPPWTCSPTTTSAGSGSPRPCWPSRADPGPPRPHRTRRAGARRRGRRIPGPPAVRKTGKRSDTRDMSAAAGPVPARLGRRWRTVSRRRWGMAAVPRGGAPKTLGAARGGPARPATAAEPRGGGGPPGRGAAESRMQRIPQLLDRPLTSYYLLFSSCPLLMAFGLTLVLSSSLVDSSPDTGSVYSLFQKQLVAAAIGLPLMLLASHLPLKVFRAIGYPAMLVSVALLVLTVFKGEAYNSGAVRWLEIGGLTVQASEP